MPNAADVYPIIPHENAGAEDVGLFGSEIDGEHVRLLCNECGAVAATITREQLEAGFVSEALRFAEVTTARRRFSSVDAFICSECGRGVSIERLIQ